MGRNGNNHSESLMRVQGGSPCRRSPSRRERLPGQHKMSDRSSSPGREKQKHSSHEKPQKNTVSRSLSPRSRRLMRAQDEREAEKVAQRETKRKHGRGSDKKMLRERPHSPSPRTKQLRSHERDADRMTEKCHERNNGKTVEKGQHSPNSRSPSPQLNHLRRAVAEKELEYAIEGKHKNHGRGNDKGRRRERNSEWETGSRSKERRPSDREIESERKKISLRRDETSHKTSRAGQELSTSPSIHRSRRRSRSPQSVDDIRARDEVSNGRGAEHGPNDDDSVAKMKAAEEALDTKEKQKPSFELSGKLAAETNRFRGVTLLFNEPPDARRPDIRWRLYVFKAGEVLKEPLYIHRQTCYLFGRERRVADIPTDHPSCSKQHAVIQFRQVEKEQPDGTLSKQVRPYLMDLGSTNKTLLNDNPIEPQRYYELFEKDTIKFGNSSREYVVLHENSVN